MTTAAAPVLADTRDPVYTVDSPMGRGRSRLLGTPPATSLWDHEERYGPLPSSRLRNVTSEVEAAGLRGRGGAGFPTHLKMQAVRAATRRGLRNRSAVVVANGTEGEPASAKDKVLLRVAPHLVLDGMVAAAVAVGADRAVLCIDRSDRQAIASVRRALEERRRHDPLAIEVAEVPSRYVAGEETALVSWLNGGLAKPTFAPPRPSDRGVGGAPTLVDNVETLANVALIVRFGADAYRLAGEVDEPGSMLVTLTGVARPGVYEAEIGTPLAEILRWGGALESGAVDSRLPASRVAGSGAVLVGGYFGTWLTPQEAAQATMSTRGLRPLGASPGCGLVAVMPDGHCPLEEVARVLGWLAANSAGQCGACVNGLPALAGTFDSVVAGDRDGRGAARLDRWVPMVAGRGACKLPDGAVRFLDSARRVFASHIEEHRRHGSCPPNRRAVLPTPRLGGWR